MLKMVSIEKGENKNPIKISLLVKEIGFVLFAMNGNNKTNFI